MKRPFLMGLFRPAPFDESEDANAAPGAYHGAGEVEPWTWARAKQNRIWIYLFGLVFLLLNAPGLTDGATPGIVALRLVTVVLIGVTYPLAALVVDTSLAIRWLFVSGFTAVIVASSTVWGSDFSNFGVFVAVLLATMIPWRQSRFVGCAWGLFLVAVWYVSGNLGALFLGIVSAGTTLVMAGGMEAGRVARQLARSRRRVSTLSVAAERERIGRDLHDILGHSLTAISIKAGLAAKLIDADPPAAREQVAEIESIARQALADVRATASGLTEIRLATELASARSVLLAAGVEANVPSAVPPMSDETSELFGYVVREAVTNVVRHAEASLCTISVTPTEVRVADDGIGRAGTRGSGGHGLQGMIDRVSAAGGTVEVDSRPGAGTVIVARLSAAESVRAAEAAR
jgi:two-component system, NarL family, sensor histidine kinase DesK